MTFAWEKSPYKLNRVSSWILLCICVCLFSLFYCPQTLWRCCWPLRLSLLLLFLLLLMLPGVHELSLARNEKFDFYSQRKCAQSFIRFVLSGCLKPWDSTRRGFIHLSGQWKCRKRCRCPVWEREKSLYCFRTFFRDKSKAKGFHQQAKAMSIFELLRFPFPASFLLLLCCTHKEWKIVE